MKNLPRPLVNLACLLSFFGISACSSHTPLPTHSDPRLELSKRVAEKPEPAILFVGNSYSFGVPKAFSKLAAEHGKKLRIGHATYGGWTLQQHSENAATLRKIREGRWDIIVIQEQSEIPALPPRKRDPAMFPPLRKLVAQVHQEGAIPILYQTWGRRDGDKKIHLDDFHAMNRRLRLGYQAASRNAGGLVIVPVGDAWENEFSAGRGSALFVEDGSHPSPTGDRVTAQTFYETIFGKPQTR